MYPMIPPIHCSIRERVEPLTGRDNDDDDIFVRVADVRNASAFEHDLPFTQQLNKSSVTL